MNILQSRWADTEHTVLLVQLNGNQFSFEEIREIIKNNFSQENNINITIDADYMILQITKTA